MKHKVIGLFAVYALYAVLGLFGICLCAGEANPQPPPRAYGYSPARPPSLNSGPFSANFQGVQTNPVQYRARPAAVAAAAGYFGKGGFGGGGGQFGGQIGGQTDLFGKKVIGIEDGPTKVLAATEAVPTPPAKSEFVNPKVEPGKVKWHADFDAACKAAAKSGKPVLLFQMMGKLDDQFC